MVCCILKRNFILLLPFLSLYTSAWDDWEYLHTSFQYHPSFEVGRYS